MKKRNLLKQLMLTLSFFLLGGVSAWAQNAQRQTLRTWTFTWSDETKKTLNLTTTWRKDNSNVCYYEVDTSNEQIKINNEDIISGLTFTASKSNIGLRSTGLHLVSNSSTRIHLASLSAGNIVKITSSGGSSSTAQYLEPESVSDETIKVKEAVDGTKTKSQTYSYEVVAANSYSFKLNGSASLQIQKIEVYENADAANPIEGKSWDFESLYSTQFPGTVLACLPIKNSTDGMRWSYKSDRYEIGSTLESPGGSLKVWQSTISETNGLTFTTTAIEKIRIKTADNTLFLQSGGGNIVTIPVVPAGGKVIIVTNVANRITDGSDNNPSSTDNDGKTYIFDVESAGSFSFKNSGDVSISSIKVEGPQYATISSGELEGGTLVFGPDDVKVYDKDNAETLLGYKVGSTITVTATPDEDYYFTSFSGKKNSNDEVITVNNNQFTMPDEAVTITANFAAKTDLSTAAISLDHDSFVYDCTEKSPSVTGVTLNETPLTLNDDYIVNAITAQTNAGNAYEVTITGAGHYKGTATKTWSITPATISAVAITEITAPEKGVALDTEATCATTGITSTSAVIWKIGDTEKTGDAEANKAYTSYVTLTADGNHQFIADPLATGTINSETATVSRTDANNIVVSYTFPATALISINPTISLAGWTYGEAANTTPTVEGNTGDGSVTYQYKLTTANDDAYATFDADHYPTAAGEYNIKVNIAANGDYAAGSAVNTFTIAKAALSSLSVSITGWAWGEYNLTTNAPQVSGNTGNGTETIEYKGQTAEDYTYVTQIPIDAGNYTVRVSVAETDNYQAGFATANFTIVTATNYSVTLPAASNGNSITATKTSNAHVGDEITLTINTNDNYTLKSIYGDHSIELSTVQNQPTKRKFTMPAADVTITAAWEEKTEGNAKTQITEEVKIEGDNAEITKVDMAETTTTVTISSSVGGKTVTSIDADAFSGLTNDQKANLQTVDLSSTGIVLTMARDAGDSPFRDLDANTLVYLPEGSSMAGQNVIIKDGANYSCIQFVMTDAKSYDIPHAFSATSAFLVRDFTNGQTCTVCLPFSVPAGNIPGKIYRFTSISGNQVTMAEDTDGLDANVPYILVPNDNDNIYRYGGGITVQITGATAENDNFTFKGIYEDHTFTAAEISKGIYGFAGNNAVGATPGHFAKAATGAYIKGMRAYLEYTGGSTDPGLNDADIPSGARGESANELPEILNVVLVNADGSTTSIGKLELIDVDDDNTPRYNLSGQRVGKDYKGIVIINGKKVIIK